LIRTLAAGLMLCSLAACGSFGTDTPLPHATRSSGKPALPAAPPPPPLPDDPVLCPADVKACDNGRFVSRDSSLDCAFPSCPGEIKP
jgi:hypothetical protein